MEQNSNSDAPLVRLDNFPKAAEFINAVLSQKYKIIIYGGAIRGGKAQPFDADIITPFGVRKMRDMEIGSQLSNPDGTVSRVIGIYPQGFKDIYKVEFVDGTSVECCGDHLWNYHKAMSRVKADREYGLWKTATTLQIQQMLKTRNVSIPITKPVKFARGKTMPIDPYVIGLLLGDGGLTGGSIIISTADQEVIDYLRNLFEVVHRSNYDYCIKDDNLRGYLNRSGLMGCNSATKFIPEMYKHAKIEDRWELVKGLMDSDGYMDERGHAEYVSVSKVMYDDMMFMLRSLGFKVTQSEKETTFTYKGEKKNGKRAYRLYIQSDNNKELFRLERKRKNAYQCRYERKKRIRSIKRIGGKRCVCISVDNPNGLYLTNDFNVTHNTFNAIAGLILLHKLYPKSRSAIVRKDLEVLRKNMLPSCDKAIPNNFIKKYKADPQIEWTFMNDSKMFFFAEGFERDKELKRWNGLEVNYFLLEQIEELQMMALEKAMERAGSYFIIGEVQPEPLIIITINPTKTWAKEMIYDRYMDGTLPETWKYIPASITDNPTVPQSFMDGLQELKKLNPIKYQRFVEGDWEVQDIIEGAFYKLFDYESTVGSYRYDRSQPLHISFDFNVNPYMTMTIYQVEIIQPDENERKGRVQKIIRQVDELCLGTPKNSTPAICKAFSDKYRSHNKGLFVYGDPSGNQQDTRNEVGHNDYKIIKNHLMKFKPTMRVADAAPPVVMRGNFINEIFAHGYEGIEIYIDENCSKSVKDFTFLQEDADGKKKKSKKTDPVSKVSYEELGHCFVKGTKVRTIDGH